MTISRRAFLATSALAGAATCWSHAAPDSRKLVMIAGTPSHGPGDHEFNAGVQLLDTCLKSVPGLSTKVILNGFPKDASVLDNADAIFCFADGGAGHPFLRENNLQLMNKLMDKGVGLMCAHYAVEVPKDIGAKEFRQWIGGCYEHMYSCNPMWTPEFNTFPEHPITRGVQPFRIRDEWYFNMRFRDGMEGITPILSAVPSDEVRNGPYVYPKGPYPHIQEAKGRSEHMMWACERADGGRGVGFTGGHMHRNWLDPNFRKVVLNALLWISKLEIPAQGVPSEVSETAITANLDPKPKRK